jgi:L-asparaginase II
MTMGPLTENFITVNVLRGADVESQHRVAWAAVTGGGRESGDSVLRVHTRSTLKVLNADLARRWGVAERFELTSAHLAVACGSHSGGEETVAAVADLLARCALTETDLVLPTWRLERLSTVAHSCGLHCSCRSQLRDPCSGAHGLALAMCLSRGWPVRGYLEQDHPLQRALRLEVSRWVDDTGELKWTPDGCGLPTYYIRLASLARIFGYVARIAADPGSVGACMRTHPELIGSRSAIDTALMRDNDGVIAKLRAEGLVGIGFPDGSGMAVKVIDGNPRAIPDALVALGGPTVRHRSTLPCTEGVGSSPASRLKP